MLICRLIVCLCFAGIVAGALSAQTWDETINGGGDAGELVGTAQIVAGSGALTEITGDNPTNNDRDLFLIRISNPAAFSATTNTNPGTNADTQLWLFTSTGVGIAFNDDVAQPNYLSTLPVGNPLYNALTPGDYLIGVSPWLNHATSSAGQMFPNAYDTVVGPTNVGGGTNTLSGWTLANNELGTYRVTLTGAEYVFVAAPNMEIGRATMPVADGGTDSLGMVSTSGQPFTYTINNVGNANLTLNGTPLVDVTPGTGAPTVDVTQLPTSPVTPAGMTTFEITVTPALGAFDFTVSIANDDPTKNPYNFTVDGTGFIPNLQAVANPSTGSSFSGPTDGPFSMPIDPGFALTNAVIDLTDPESDNIAILSVTETSATAAVGIVPPAVAGAATSPVALTFGGTADGSNAPGTYSWDIVFEDAVNGTGVTITVNITINDVDPAHAIANATGGNGNPGTPYTGQFTQGDTGANSINLCTVTDDNTSQVINLVGTTAGGSNPAGGAGLVFNLAAGVLTVMPGGTLVAADRGTHTFDVEISDGTNNVIIAVEIEVVGIPPSITSAPVTSATPGKVYAYTVVAIGTPAPTVAVTSTLPGWLTFNAGTGVLSGTPTKSDEKTTVNVTITAGNGVTPDATQTFAIQVKAAPSSDSDGGSSCSGGSGTLPLLAVFALAALGGVVFVRRRKA
jgi:hypothetical protein